MSIDHPIRTCIGCRIKRNKSELLRIVRTPCKEIKIDLHFNTEGRGAYLCFDVKCAQKAIKHRSIERQLSVPVPTDFVRELFEVMDGSNGKGA